MKKSENETHRAVPVVGSAGEYTVSTQTSVTPGISQREYGCLAGQHEKDEQHSIRLNEVHICRWCKALYWSGE
jgi:hypothetical protein